MPTSLEARLDKLAPSLSAKERILLLLQADHAGAPEDPDIRRTMPVSQRRAFNRYAHLVYAVNAQLWSTLMALAAIVDNLEYGLERFGLLDEAARILEEDYAKALAPHEAAGEFTVPMFLRDLQRDLEASLRRELSLRWRELRAIDQLWAEAKTQFDGECIRHPRVLELAEKTKTRLIALSGALAREGKRPRLPEPSPELVEQFRAVIRHAYTQHGWAEDDAPQEPNRRNPRGR